MNYLWKFNMTVTKIFTLLKKALRSNSLENITKISLTKLAKTLGEILVFSWHNLQL